MFMSSTLEASVIMGKNYSENLHSIKNTGNNLSLKQMFDISEKLIIGQSDDQLGRFFMETIYLWSVMKKSSVSHTRRFMYVGILCYALAR